MGTLRAPLDIAGVEQALAEFGWSRTLPPAAYHSTEVFAWEQEHFFEQGWVCVGRAAGLAQPGEQRAVRAGRETLLLVRDEEGALRAFYDVCRHRGHELLAAGCTAHARVIRCPYHGWTYGLDGALRAAPRFGDQPGFATGDYQLSACRAEEWHGWVFVNASGDAPALADCLGDLKQRVQTHQPERLKTLVRQEYEVAANWKLMVENYHECYHCPNIHPQLCRVTPPDSGKNVASTGLWVGGSMDLMEHADTMSLDGKGCGLPLPGLDEKQRRQVYYYGLFPNLLLSLHPDYVLTHRLEPLAADRTRIECEWLFPAETIEQPGFDPAYAVEFWDATNRQDWGACESVQRGTGSRGYRPGPLARKEDAVYQFITLIGRAYLGGSLLPAQPASRNL